MKTKPQTKLYHKAGLFLLASVNGCILVLLDLIAFGKPIITGFLALWGVMFLFNKEVVFKN